MTYLTFKEIQEFLEENDYGGLSYLPNTSIEASQVVESFAYVDILTKNKLPVFSIECSEDLLKEFQFNMRQQAPELYQSLAEKGAFLHVPVLAYETRILHNMEYSKIKYPEDAVFEHSKKNYYYCYWQD